MSQKYEHGHTKAWSATVAAADAHVFVAPEYNYGRPPHSLRAVSNDATKRVRATALQADKEQA
jgi:hypothetical protein